MSVYALGHLAIAAFCALFAVAHVFLWRANRADRVQLVLALGMAGFALLSTGLAGSSTGAHDFGSTVPWLILANSTAMLLWPVLSILPPMLAGRPVSRTRRVIVVVAAGLGVGRGVDVAVRALEGGLTFWEDGIFDFTQPTTWVHWVVCFGAIGLWLFDAILNRKRDVATLVLVGAAALVAGLVMVRETLPVMQGRAPPPSLFDTTGLVFVALASGLLFVKLGRLLRRRTEDDALSGYEVIRPIAEGGMGQLVLARKHGPGGFERDVALKRMHAHRGPVWVTRFLLEARLAARLNHPNIVTIFELGRAGDGWFIAMEYLAGVSLSQLLRHAHESKQVPWQVVAAIGEQVCRGAYYAHCAGVFHRDIKPGNVMLTFEGVVKLVDFGIAIAKDDRSGNGVSPGQLTKPGAVIGTPEYLAPERAQGAQASAATDQYAIGVVLGELLVARQKIESLNLGALRPDAPPELVHTIERAFNRDPSKRWPDVETLGLALRRVGTSSPIDLATWLRDYLPAEWNAMRSTVRPEPEQRVTIRDRPI